VSSLVSCLSGKALEWENAVWGEGDAAQDHLEDFTRRFRAVFYHLRQGTWSAKEFAMDFRTLATGAG
jgi:hypothetical protein